jgi:hypothetical protein
MVPDRNTIKKFIEKFQTTASAANKIPAGSVRTVWTPENTGRV